MQEVLIQPIENLYVIPSRIDLFMAELEIFETEEREKKTEIFA